MSYLPSKKVRVVALVVLIVLIGVFWYVGKQNTKGSAAKSLIYTNPELAAEQKQETKLADFIATKIAEQSGLQNASSSDFAPQIVYIAKNLTTSNDNSSTSLKQYGLTIKNHLAPLTTASQNEALLTIEAIDKQDQTKVTAIKNRAGEFHTMTSLLASTTVPTKAVTIHLELVNGLAHLGSLLDQMALALNEPIVALEAARAYAVDAVEFYNVLNNTNAFFNDNKINFANEERLQVELGATQ